MDMYILKSSGDHTDRKAEIEEMLREQGVCILGSGVFYVSGIVMPENATLQGLGECSVLHLAEEAEAGYAVTMNTCCRIMNLTIRGAEEAVRPEEMGNRHGIGFLGNADPKVKGVLQHRYGILDNLHIFGFSGGGITCYGTGFAIDSSLTVTNCRIHGCGAGINIAYFSEFHRFTNVTSNRNIYGCINNGGNNVFSACSFDGNKLGFLIDNRNNQSPNNAHGTATACTFDHSDNNKGVGIMVLGVKAGYVFNSCQLYYSKIVVENSKGIQFSHLNCGRDEEIIVKDGTVVTFTDCIFTNQPIITVENNPNVIFRDCYTKKGEVQPVPLPAE